VSTWSQDTLRKIAEADDLHIVPLREDGETYGAAAIDGLCSAGRTGPEHQMKVLLRQPDRQEARAVGGAGVLVRV
jgi:hypothetical protein